MAELPPGVKVVGRIPAPGGGEWVLGSDGGVFSLGGAQFYGAYTTLQGQDPSRQWSHIDPTVEGGYMLTDTTGHTYHFNPPPKSAPPPPPAPAPTNPGTAQPPPGDNLLSGEQIINDALGKYGLADLGKELLSYYRGPANGSIEATYIKMRETDQYKKRFAGMEARRAAGYAPISEEQYVAWEGAAKSLFDHYQLPKEFYDTPEELATFIGGDVSPTELRTRIEDGYVAAMDAAPELRNALQDMYGVDQAHLAAFFLDPQAGEKAIQKKWVSAQIGGQATKAGFGGLTKEEAEKLQAAGLTGAEAQARFGVLGQQKELFGVLPGEAEGPGIGREDQLAAAGGDVAAQERIKRKGQERTAQFQGGGTFAGGQTGLSGLGEAT